MIIEPGSPVLLIIKEVLEGDIKKFQTKSNMSKTGGGARDLRFPKRFTPQLERIFPSLTQQSDIVYSTVFWQDTSGNCKSVELALHKKPTVSRATEVRLGRIYMIDAWNVSRDYFVSLVKQDLKLFYLLLLDSNGRVWARISSQEYVEDETEIVKNYLKKILSKRKRRNAIIGSIDFSTGNTFP